MLYHIKDATNRKNTNLTTYTNEIKSGVLSVFPKAIVNIQPNYFVVYASNVTNKDLRKMGKAIASHSEVLNSLKKTYGNSKQLFVAF